MRLRVAKRVLNAYGPRVEHGPNVGDWVIEPRRAVTLGIFPWKWSTWVEAHRVWCR